MSPSHYRNNSQFHKYRHQLRRALPLVIIDIVIMLTSYVITFAVRTETAPASFTQRVLIGFALTVLVTLISLFIFGGYNRIWSRTSGHDVTVIIFAVTFSTILVGAGELILGEAHAFTGNRPMPLSVLLVGNLVSMSGFVAVRYRSRLLHGLSWRWRAVWHVEFPEKAVRVLIVGAGDAGQTTAWRFKHRAPNGDHKYEVVGFVDDDPDKLDMYIEGAPVLGTRAEIPVLAQRHRVELIAVAIHNVDGPGFRDILTYCERTDARIKIIPDVFAHIHNNNGSPLLRDVRPEDLLGRQTVGWHEGIDVSPISNKVILVTGAAGSIGSELCRQLVKYDTVKLIMLDNNESGLHDLVTELQSDAAPGVLGPALADITNRRTLTRVFEQHRPQVVFHSAAYKHVPMLEHYPDEAIRVNIGGTQQVAGLARDFGVERFVLISTDKAVNPSSVMGASKRICELLMHALATQSEHNTLFTSVRFGNVLGSRGSVVPTFNRQINAGGPVTITDKEMTRYFMTIPEAVNLVIHAACLTKGDDLFMLRMGEVVRIVDLAERMIRLRGLRPYKDVPIQFTGIRPGEKLHEELHDNSEAPVPTPHPFIVELVSRRNGLQPVKFSDQLNGLFEHGLDKNRSALEQLGSLINVGENYGVEHPT